MQNRFQKQIFEFKANEEEHKNSANDQLNIIENPASPLKTALKDHPVIDNRDQETGEVKDDNEDAKNIDQNQQTMDTIQNENNEQENGGKPDDVKSIACKFLCLNFTNIVGSHLTSISAIRDTKSRFSK